MLYCGTGQEELANFSPKEQLIGGLWLYIHAVPWIFLISIFCRVFLHEVMDIPTERTFWDLYFGDIAFGIAVGIAGGIVGVIVAGFAGGITGGIAEGISRGIAAGTVGGIAFGITFGIAGGVAGRIADGIALGIVLGISIGIVIGVGIAGGIAYGIVVGIALDVVEGIAFGIAFGIAVGIATPRSFYLPFHFFLVWPKTRAKWYAYHPLAWDRLIGFPFWRFDRLLADYTLANPRDGQREIERLIEQKYQRTSALKARIRVLARMGHDTSIEDLPKLLADLPSGEQGFLAQSDQIRSKAQTLARQWTLAQKASTPLLRESRLQGLAKDCEALYHQLAGFAAPLPEVFRPAAQSWQQQAEQELILARRQRDKALEQVFRAGDPVDPDEEAFTPREAIIGQLEAHLTQPSGCPGIVLYGRRRMGKTTVLKNLPLLLPETMIPVFFSAQNPRVFSGPASLTRFMLRTVSERAEDLDFDLPATPGLVELMDMLDHWQTILAQQKRRLILCFDEYNNLDEKIAEGVYSVDLPATIRESIQSHRNIIWIFAGSHRIEELTKAPWTSYLVSTRTVEVPPFTPDETYLLLTDPLKFSPLFNADQERPRFDPAVWGTHGIERIQNDCAGWPHLVQLMAETIINYLREQGRDRLGEGEYAHCLDLAARAGHNLFHELIIKECAYPEEHTWLEGFTAKVHQKAPDHDPSLANLKRRALIRETDEGWTMIAPLMRHWLMHRPKD